MVKLQPCPNCGSKVALSNPQYSSFNVGTIECFECGLKKDISTGWMDGDFISPWNAYCKEYKRQQESAAELNKSLLQAKQAVKAKKIIQTWIDKQGHDRCHYYPELFNQLAELFEIKATKKPKLPPRKEFEKGCKNYQNEEYGNVKKSRRNHKKMF